MTNAVPARKPAPKILVETSRELPLVSVSVALRTGAILDPPGVEGGTTRSTIPDGVGAGSVAPRVASTIVSGRSMLMSRPSRR